LASSGADFWVTYWWITQTILSLCYHYYIGIVQYTIFLQKMYE
jgi:hypothetical protein